MYPVVTAVMVTGKSPDRLPMARLAVKAFEEQTYPAKELLIINDSNTPVLQHPSQNMRELRVDKGFTLGELRNFGLRHARGDWICQWDDDDYYAPDRLALQMVAASGRNAVLLRCQVRYSFLSDSAYVMRWSYKSCPGIPGTILHPNCGALFYPRESRAEDEIFIAEHFPSDVIVINNESHASVYLRFFHGNNTWDENHVMGNITPGTRLLSSEDNDYLEQVIREYSIVDNTKTGI